MIKNIIFDLGCVVMNQPKDVNDLMVERMFGKEYEKGSALWKRYMPQLNMGQITSRDFLSICKKELTMSESLDELYPRWKDSYGFFATPNKDVLHIIDSLHKNHYKTYILTDTIDAHYEYAQDSGVFNHVIRVFASFKEGVWKQNGSAFRNILTKLHTSPEECLFIDDREDFITLAKEFGMNGIVFKNAETLKEDLKQKKLL